MTARLIVHADDFGLSQSINEGIRDAHVNGVLTSTSLMAVGGAFEDAVTIAHATPSLDVGIHLTLVEERPLSETSEITSLLQPDGTFPADAQALLFRVLKGQVDTEHVRRELDAQFRRILDAGLQPTHIDSHQHVHVIPAIRRVALSLAEQYGVRWIRVPRAHIRPYMLQPPAGWKRVVQMLVLAGFCRVGNWGSLQSCPHFAGFYEGGKLNSANLKRVLNNLPASDLCELMCHPGQSAAEPGYSHWGYQWVEELTALLDRDARRIIDERRVERVSFTDGIEKC